MYGFFFSSLTAEGKNAKSSQEQLWELLSPSWLSGGLESSSWHQSYCHLLKEKGVDAEMQKRALLLQLWTTQVSEVYCLSLPHTRTNTAQNTYCKLPHPHCKLEFHSALSLPTMQTLETAHSSLLSCVMLPVSTCYSEWSFYILVMCICFHDTP